MGKILTYQLSQSDIEAVKTFLKVFSGTSDFEVYNYHVLNKGDSLLHYPGHELELINIDQSASKVYETASHRRLWGSDAYGVIFNKLSSHLGVRLILGGPFKDSHARQAFLLNEIKGMLGVSSAPILLLSAGEINLDLKRIVFASDFDQEDQDAFIKLIGEMNFEDKDLDLLAVDTAQFFTQPDVVMKEVMKSVAEKAHPHSVDTHFKESSSVERGIHEFIEEHNPDLLIMCNHSDKKLKHNLWGNALESLVHHLNIPTLIINE